MITIHSAMLVLLGFLVAALLGFLLAPLYRRRAARLATEALKRTMPLTTAEIRADKDRLRAQYAIAIHRLEARAEESSHAAAKQMVEINRRDAAISGLETELARLKTALEEHENARRVLEHTITDRLPKVEFRLADAKQLLVQRDREISTLTNSATRQAHALEESTQINTQQRDEIHRLKATLTTRAARNRESLSDPRFDGEVALRAEIESLRAKTRDQAQLISRLQGVLMTSGARTDQIAGLDQNGARPGEPPNLETEIQRLRKDLAEAEIALKSARGMAEAGQTGLSSLEAEVRSLKSAEEDRKAEIAKLKAALKAYEAEDADEKAVKDSKIAMRARLSALEAQGEEQAVTIRKLRAEIAAANEKLARQAAHFMEEMRRLGTGSVSASGPGKREAYEQPPQKKSLVERIQAPRPPRTKGSPATKGGEAKRTAEDPARVSGFLRALDGDTGHDSAGQASAGQESASAGSTGSGEPGKASAASSAGGETAKSAASRPAGRRSGLLERITGIDKPAAPGE